MKLVDWVLGRKEKPAALVCKDCQELTALTAAVAALSSVVESMRVTQSLHLELVRDLRGEVVEHHKLVLRLMDFDGTPPWGRPIGIERAP